MTYIEEALALKVEFFKRRREFREKHRHSTGKDTNLPEEKKIQNWYAEELKKLREKYGYTS